MTQEKKRERRRVRWQGGKSVEHAGAPRSFAPGKEKGSLRSEGEKKKGGTGSGPGRVRDAYSNVLPHKKKGKGRAKRSMIS